VADLTSRGFAAHVANARVWRQGELLSCTLELIGQPYLELRLRIRYVVFGGDEKSLWRVGFQLAEDRTGRGERAIGRLLETFSVALRAT
jgi:hypothetical protein